MNSQRDRFEAGLGDRLAGHLRSDEPAANVSRDSDVGVYPRQANRYPNPSEVGVDTFSEHSSPQDTEIALGPAFQPEKPVQLNQYLATAICGNDILGSCLYAAGLVAVPAGRWAPVCFFLVAMFLYLFRIIYEEVGHALPINGGTYTLLLNSSSKGAAVFAGSLTLLSYVATAVVSANSAMHYLHQLLSVIGVYWATVVLLFIFALVNLVGIRESAYNALAIFVLHLCTLVVYTAACLTYMFEDGFATLWANLSTPPPDNDFMAVFCGFAVALMGLTGYETCGNYLESQGPRVYSQVLRNIWWLVLLVNPLVALLSLGVVPQAALVDAKTHLLSTTALLAQGQWLKIWVNIDAVLVLSGSVLTAFVGVQGLIHRMALDGCLPRALTELSAARRTPHVAILVFFLVSVALQVVCDGDIRVLSGVYTVAFVSLLGCFALGDWIMQRSRPSLPRVTRAPQTTLALAVLGVVAGLVGTIVYEPDNVVYALFCMLACFAAVAACTFRTTIVKALAALLTLVGLTPPGLLVEAITKEHNRGIVFLLQDESMDDLRRVCAYVVANEERKMIKFVKVTPTPLSPAEHTALRNRIDALAAEALSTASWLPIGAAPSGLSVEGALHIRLETAIGELGGAVVQQLHHRWNIPPNYMFIGCPAAGATWNYASMGGVRIILQPESRAPAAQGLTLDRLEA